MIVAVIATESCVAASRETVRSVQAVDPTAHCEVLDLDGCYKTHGRERVRTPDEVELRVEALRLTHDDATILTALTALWTAHLLTDDESVLGLVPGVILVNRPAWSDDPGTTVAVVRAVTPTPEGAAEQSILANEFFMLGTDARPHKSAIRRLAEDWRTAHRWLDLFVARVRHRILIDDAVLVSSMNSGPHTILDIGDNGFTRAGRPILALDLAGMMPGRPWLFDSRPGSSSGPLLSRNPALAAFVEDVASRERHDAVSAGARRADSDVVRFLARTATEAGETLDAALSRLEDWLLELLPPGERMPVTRYLAGIRDSRPDLVHSFPQVPGRDSVRLARWAHEHGVHEPAYEPMLLRRAADLTIAALPVPEKTGRRRPRGVNLVGYLSGELGIGTSARLMDAALKAARIPTSTFAASAGLQSRQSATYRRSDGTRFDISLLAVNADQTEAVSESLDDVVAHSYRIGMWYWEVESFPASRDGAFSFVDEVWVATDFIREAIAARATVPVRTVMPPLPQRSAVVPPKVPARLGVPAHRPWFFFAFDYLSTVERKNPLGLIEAFARAFPSGDAQGPVLVIKTLNAARRPGDAERLRLVASRRQDVILIDDYLESDELTALMARCTAYVSLHRAEGLGLTIAEAMAWGRPVVVTAYSGNMQFTNSRNAFLVPCTMTSIPPDADPYPHGTPWADPDLDYAATVLRRIVDDPAAASALGAQAAQDVRVLHSPAAAASRVNAALDAAWSRKDRMRAHRAVSPVRALARRLKSRVRRG